MIKFTTSAVTFEEIPTEVTLSLAISNCQGNCPGCHSPELRGDNGLELTEEVLDALIRKNSGVGCVLFLGEGNSPSDLIRLAERVRNHWKLRVALYSGRSNVEDELWHHFDYIKIGPYIEALGPINKVTTNQKLYRYSPWFSDVSLGHRGWRDITCLFWRK